MKLLIVDNYDSFTYNLYYYFCELGIKPCVVENDFKKNIQDAQEFLNTFDYFVISPGFGSPKDSGLSIPIIQTFAPFKKILGVCLGHQCIAVAFGGFVIEMPNPLHAKNAICYFNKNPLCKNIKNPIKVALYNSLFVSDLGDCEMLGYSLLWNMKIPMILKHKFYNTYGIQFHPESILQENGKKILNNFLRLK